MIRSRMAQAVLIGCLAALAGFCALQAGAEETYSIVAQSTPASAGTGRRPVAERIAAANLPIITRSDAAKPADSARTALGNRDVPRGPSATRPQETAAAKQTARSQTPTPTAATPTKEQGPTAAQPATENMAVAAVDVVRAEASAAAAQPAPAAPKPRLPTPPVRWPFTTRQPEAIAQQEAASSQKRAKAAPQSAAATQSAAGKQRQSTARSSGKGLSSSSPDSVTR
jgi:hypothetical protein